MTAKRCTILIVLVAVALCLTPTAWAQIEFTYGVSYFSNAHTAGAPDSTTRLVNPGTTGAYSPFGDVCASIYVVDYNEQLASCCSCRVTPNGELELSTNALTQNPGNGVTLNHGDIKIVASTPNSAGKCDPTQALPIANASIPITGLDGWQTHVQKTSSTTFTLTETGYTLSFGTYTTNTNSISAVETAEINDLAEDCLEIAELDSGNGQCQQSAVNASGVRAGTPGCTQ
jgi:hypothetical protein